ncbi:MAG: hypothetical protein MPK62_02620 [Alphaproteobacteria bacterium]|nr:hypothetical protein [Alphaproteobacteria bacterium]
MQDGSHAAGSGEERQREISDAVLRRFNAEARFDDRLHPEADFYIETMVGPSEDDVAAMAQVGIGIVRVDDAESSIVDTHTWLKGFVHVIMRDMHKGSQVRAS